MAPQSRRMMRFYPDNSNMNEHQSSCAGDPLDATHTETVGPRQLAASSFFLGFHRNVNPRSRWCRRPAHAPVSARRRVFHPQIDPLGPRRRSSPHRPSSIVSLTRDSPPPAGVVRRGARRSEQGIKRWVQRKCCRICQSLSMTLYLAALDRAPMLMSASPGRAAAMVAARVGRAPSSAPESANNNSASRKLTNTDRATNSRAGSATDTAQAASGLISTA